MSKQLDSRPFDLWAFFLNMSSTSREKVTITWGGVVAVLLIVNVGGVVDIRRCVEALNKLPDMQKMVEQNSKDIREIEAVLRRNKLVSSGPDSVNISTAQYNE